MKNSKVIIPRGAYLPIDVTNCNCNQVLNKPGYWVQARPMPYPSFFSRLRQAWDVLTYKADALYWEDQ
jgi:hypothetical protein